MGNRVEGLKFPKIGETTIFGGQGARSFRFWSIRSCGYTRWDDYGMIDTMMDTKCYEMMKLWSDIVFKKIWKESSQKEEFY